MPTKELENIRDHADKLKAEIIKESGTKPDPNGAATAALVPEFSKGTRALDETTGLPVGEQAPAFSDTTVTKPPGTEITGKTPEAEAAAPVAEPRKRDEKTGQFVGEAAPEGAAEGAAATAAPAEAQSGQAPAQVAAGAAAASEAAAQVGDESETWEFKDPDLEVPITLKYDKKFHDTVQRAFPRRADYDRLRNRLGEAEPVLRPMLENGSIKQVLPLLQMAQQDREFADAVWLMHTRRLQGLPMVEQVQVQAPLQAQPQYQQQQPIQGQEAPFVDPLLESALQPYEAKWQQRYSALENKFTTMAEQQQQAAARQREEQQRQAGIANEMMAAHQDLQQMFPGEFNVALGPNDPGWQKAQSMTQQGGYAQTYGIRAGLIFGYQRAREIEQERLAATASPAAQSLADLDNRQVQLAQQQAAQAARTVAGGAPTQAAPPTPRPRPATTMKMKDGSIVKRPVDEYLSDLTEFVREQSQQAS